MKDVRMMLVFIFVYLRSLWWTAKIERSASTKLLNRVH